MAYRDLSEHRHELLDARQRVRLLCCQEMRGPVVRRGCPACRGCQIGVHRQFMVRAVVALGSGTPEPQGEEKNGITNLARHLSGGTTHATHARTSRSPPHPPLAHPAPYKTPSLAPGTSSPPSTRRRQIGAAQTRGVRTCVAPPTPRRTRWGWLTQVMMMTELRVGMNANVNVAGVDHGAGAGVVAEGRTRRLIGRIG